MKKKELIDLINGYSGNTFDDIERILPPCVKCVATNLEIEEHPRCSTCVNVYACEDGYVGIRSINSYFFSYYYGGDYRNEASEYEEVTMNTYKPKKV